MLTSEHLRAARAMLKMTQLELAKICDISEPSVKKYEADNEALISASQKKIDKIKKTLEERGIKFSFSEEDGKRIMGVKYFQNIEKKE